MVLSAKNTLPHKNYLLDILICIDSSNKHRKIDLKINNTGICYNHDIHIGNGHTR